MNRSSTRVEVRWNVAGSSSISDHQRGLLLRKLASRIDSSGTLRITAEDQRSQLRNREAAVKRLNELVSQALDQPPPRRKTRPSVAAVKKRLEEKRRRSRLKQERRSPDLND